VPFILVMVGVLGGAAAFGLLGVFVGPTLLAVANAVLRDWVKAEAGERPVQLAPVPPAAAAGGEHGKPAPI
jgi:predicted PurR-regulated permease PerM